ncbi:MAG: nucleotidyltransferase family protein [Bacteroides sp.]|nr:nucleotidyltransferase family protein [Bacteroides sp.]MCM1094741.1 nucleotidyltransferase family protein [Terasakiella sp.]
MMTGMIFAAGYGTRLKPWTDSHPKALVPVGGRPALDRVVERMLDAGIDRIVVNTHHFAGQIHEHIASRPWAGHILISHEPELLDTGGGLRKALPLIGDSPVLIHNADIMTDIDLRAMMDTHDSLHAEATLLTDCRASARFLLFRDEGTLCGYYRTDGTRVMPDRLPAEAIRNAKARCFDGVHIVSPSLYGDLRNFAPDDTKFSIIDFYRQAGIDHRIHCYDKPADARWYDIGRPETLAAADTYYTHTR